MAVFIRLLKQTIMVYLQITQLLADPYCQNNVLRLEWYYYNHNTIQHSLIVLFNSCQLPWRWWNRDGIQFAVQNTPITRSVPKDCQSYQHIGDKWKISHCSKDLNVKKKIKRKLSITPAHSSCKKHSMPFYCISFVN